MRPTLTCQGADRGEKVGPPAELTTSAEYTAEPNCVDCLRGRKTSPTLLEVAQSHRGSVRIGGETIRAIWPCENAVTHFVSWGTVYLVGDTQPPFTWACPPQPPMDRLSESVPPWFLQSGRGFLPCQDGGSNRRRLHRTKTSK